MFNHLIYDFIHVSFLCIILFNQMLMCLCRQLGRASRPVTVRTAGLATGTLVTAQINTSETTAKQVENSYIY